MGQSLILKVCLFVCLFTCVIVCPSVADSERVRDEVKMPGPVRCVHAESHLQEADPLQALGRPSSCQGLHRRISSEQGEFPAHLFFFAHALLRLLSATARVCPINCAASAAYTLSFYFKHTMHATLTARSHTHIDIQVLVHVHKQYTLCRNTCTI